jgi:hypothetical protein
VDVSVGKFVYMAVGKTVGIRALLVGDAVNTGGEPVGDAVSENVGTIIGDPVGDAVDDVVNNAVCDSVNNPVGNAVNLVSWYVGATVPDTKEFVIVGAWLTGADEVFFNVGALLTGIENVFVAGVVGCDASITTIWRVGNCEGSSEGNKLGIVLGKDDSLGIGVEVML